MKCSQESDLAVVVEDPLIEQTTQIIIEESFKEESPPTRPIYFCKEEVEAALSTKYALTLKPIIVLPLKEEIERALIAKYELRLHSHSQQLINKQREPTMKE